MNQPSEQEASAEVVTVESGVVTPRAWHPQIGGYTSRCVVRLARGTMCFDVYNWHDGEFASNTVVDEKHYCDASQWLRFATLILETQAAWGHVDDTSRAATCRVIDRLRALVDE